MKPTKKGEVVKTSKPFYRSKTLLFGLITSIIGLVEFLRENTVKPETMVIFGLVVISLRLIATTKLTFK